MEQFKEMLGSTRFVLLQESIALAVVLAIVKGIWKSFPLIEAFSFLGPVIIAATGWKTWENVSEKKQDTLVRTAEANNGGCK